MRRIFCSGLVLCCFLMGTSSQDKTLFKKTFLAAEYSFMTGEYFDAAYLFNDLIKIDPENANLHFLLGASYLSLYGQKEKAIPHLERAVEEISPGYREGSYKERSAPRESLFALARAYHISEDFDKAIEYYEIYRSAMIKKHFSEIEYVNSQIKSCELAKSMVKRPVDVQFLRMGEDVNKFPANYNPVVSYDDSTMIYMIDQPERNTIIMIRRLPEGGWTEPAIINDEIGSEGDVYPTSISANGKELYLVKKDGFGADIFISYMKRGQFTRMIPLNNHINTNYFETHACISANGKFLYFTSDRPGGQGAIDIWVSETTREGDWGEPRNLGPKVNSHYNEETPFVAEGGKKLYFSSQGHATMGGYDYFVAEKIPVLKSIGREMEAPPGYSIEDQDVGWSFPKNLGYPVSTADDDLFYYPRKNGRGGYYTGIIADISPSRSIYTLRIKGEEPRITALRKDREERIDPEDIPDPDVVAATETGSEQLETAQEVPDTVIVADVTAATESEPEEPGEETTVEQAEGQPADSHTETAVVEIPVGENPDEHFVLNSIMFGFDSDALDESARTEADRMLEVMLKNPGLRLQLTGHADAVGASAYNLQLSERRAQSVADYLISKGIGESRIEVTAAGETRPIALNSYEDGTDSPEGRRLNRHVSIKFENLQSDNIQVADIFVPDELKPVADRSYRVLLLNSPTMLDTIPDTVAGEVTELIVLDSAFLYTAGRFNHKALAMQYLNVVIDAGYPDAGMYEKNDMERLIADLSNEGIGIISNYTIQIMALRKPVDVAYFKEPKGVRMYPGNDGFYRYIWGEFDSADEALAKLAEIKKMGFKDAFIGKVLRYEKLSE